MSTIREENVGFLHKKLIRGKDKCETFLRQREFHLEVKPLKNSHNPSPALASTMEITPHVYNVISNDIWYHISKYIPPESVQTFALICTQTAALVRTKSFWKHIYQTYCQKFGTQIWILQLPGHLQFDNIRNFSTELFRSSVVEALFYCYDPLAKRTKEYSLDLLIGRSYISAWQKLWENCVWLICYQFRQFGLSCSSVTTKFSDEHIPPTTSTTELVNDWESLASCDESQGSSTLSQTASKTRDEERNPYEGVCLLVIFGQRFIPVPANLMYDNGSTQGSNLFRLSATRRPITSDLRGYNLELDFVDTINKTTITVKYPTVKHKVLPWWHPDFKKYIKYEDCDKFA